MKRLVTANPHALKTGDTVTLGGFHYPWYLRFWRWITFRPIPKTKTYEITVTGGNSYDLREPFA